jgi:hypothetical protein
MGQFQVSVVGTGGHGCQRDRKDGEAVLGCDLPHCPDCITREYVRRLKRTGANVTEAVLHHWPGTDSEVVDDLLTGIRKGSF